MKPKSKDQSHRLRNLEILNMNAQMIKKSYKFVNRTNLEGKLKEVSLLNPHKKCQNVFPNQIKRILYLMNQFRLKKFHLHLRRNKLLSLKRLSLKTLSAKNLLTNFLKKNHFRLRLKWSLQKNSNRIKTHKA